MEKILIIRLSSIGDIVLCTPAARCIKEQLDSEVHVISKKSFVQNWNGNPHVDKVWTYENEQESNFDALKAEGFNRIFDMHVNLRSRRIGRKIGAHRLTFNKLNVEKWLKVNLSMDWLPEVHLVDRYFDALKKWGIEDDGKGMEYHNVKSYEGKLPANFVVLVLGAAHATKMIPKQKLNEIVKEASRPMILIGGPNEKDLGEEVANLDCSNVINLAGKTSIAESADIIRRAEHVVTPDTGMMHIAAALQKPISVVWGNTVPEFGMYPFYGSLSERNWINHQVGVSCRPCSKIGYEKCPKGHFRCMMDHDVSKIWTSIS